MLPTTTYLHFAQLIDSAIPIGGFSHSFGLESFVQYKKVQTKAELQHYIEGQILSALVPFDGNIIRAIYNAFEQQNISDVLAANELYIAQKLARESRAATCKMGRQLLKLGQELFPQAKLTELDQQLKINKLSCSHVVVFSWISYSLNIPLSLCVHGYLYTAIQGYINSGLRLVSIGQTEGQKLISSLQLFAAEQWQKQEQEQLFEPYSYSLVQDILAMEHEQLYSRLFMS